MLIKFGQNIVTEIKQILILIELFRSFLFSCKMKAVSDELL